MAAIGETEAAISDVKAGRLARSFGLFVEREAMRWQRPAARILAREMDAAAESYAKYGSEDLAVAAVTEPPWELYIGRVWMTTAPRAGDMMNDLPVKAAPPDLFLQATAQWLRENGPMRIQGITETSREAIRNQIRIGIAKNENYDEIAARITKARRSITPSRARTIAQTEVHAAANFGSLTAAGDVRVPLIKVWTPRGDARTRDTHRFASGQRRYLSDAFMIGGYPLMFPGDATRAPASETVNCRCVMSYEPSRRATQPRRAA